MSAFDNAWDMLKATLPIKPETLQYETDPRRYRNYKQTGGIARRGREKMLDETRAEREQPDETDVMDQHGYRGRDREYGDSYKTFRFPDLYDKPYYADNAAFHPSLRSLIPQEEEGGN